MITVDIPDSHHRPREFQDAMERAGTHLPRRSRGMAGCTGMDVIDILKKKRQEVKGLQVRVQGKRGETHPMVYTDIEVTYIVRGANIASKAIEDAIRQSETKYCGAGAMLGKTAQITSHYEIVRRIAR